MKGKQLKRLWRLCLPLITLPLLGSAVMRAGAAGITPGDVDSDRFVDISDAVLLSRFIAEDMEAYVSEEGRKNADLNNDNMIDYKDLADLMLGIAKIKLDILYPPVTTATTPESVTTTTETVTTTTEIVQPEEEIQLTVDKIPFPYDVSVSALGTPDEMLTVHYNNGNITFAVFNKNTDKLNIAIARQDSLIVGYYIMCSEYTVPEGFKVTEYRDTVESGENGGLYAILVLREDTSIAFHEVAEAQGFEDLALLNYYALNAVRTSRKPNLNPLEYDKDAAKTAANHSATMARLLLELKEIEDHYDRDENGNLIYYKYDEERDVYGEAVLARIGTDSNGVRIHYRIYEDGTPYDDENGNRFILGRFNEEKGKIVPSEGYYMGNAGARLGKAGIEWKNFSENIACGMPDPFSMLEAWLNSVSHRPHILTEKQTTVGIGFAATEDNKLFYGTQSFYQPW